MSSTPSGVMVMGLQLEEPHGLEESMAKFRTHHKDVGDQLLNISGVGTEDGKPVIQYSPRPIYDPSAPKNRFPTMLYHADGREAIAENAKEVKELSTKNFRHEPYLKPQVAMADPKAEKVELQRKLQEKDGQIGALNDTLQRALARLDQLEAASK